MRTIEDVAGPPLLGEGAVLVLEHHRRTDASQRLGTLALYKSRRHGDTVVSIYRQEENQ
jgi:16S rRNA (guanine966-N2)-methyltransferase